MEPEARAAAGGPAPGSPPPHQPTGGASVAKSSMVICMAHTLTVSVGYVQTGVTHLTGNLLTAK